MDNHFFTDEHYIKKPKSYEWKPKEDITAHELALCVPLLVNNQSWVGSVEKYILALPESARRHFEEIGEE